VNYEIRELGPDDLDLMGLLLDCFADAFDEWETYTGNRPDPGYLASLLRSDMFIALVARVNGSVVGGLTAYELKKYEQSRSEIYIYDLAVAKDARRRGIATALIEALGHIAAERGAWVMFVQADYIDEPAISLYSGLGVREDVLHFDIPPKVKGHART